MINFVNNSFETPYIKFREKYDAASAANQKLIEAISIASFSSTSNEVDSRFVNLKIIDGNKFIFFTNYDSPKSIQFKTHNQVAVSIYWQTVNIQIRIKAEINKTSLEVNNKYFLERSIEKNALAISSDQSKTIDSYEAVKNKYRKVLQEDNLTKCPKYWGGFSFTPYYFEFWEGHNSRLNKRDQYQIKNNDWEHSILQP